jgi:flagellar hook protein FlgE
MAGGKHRENHMSFQQGLSGLNAASKQLETIGNNIANSNTVGFKASQAQFADVYANSLSGSGGGGSAGIGTKVTRVAQIFSKGNITSTNNPLDIAINGGGFFRLSNNGTISYSRNGQFELDKDGFLVNAGARLTGYSVNASGKIASGTPVEIKINNADLPPQVSTLIETQVNLDASKDAIPAAKLAAFDPNDSTTFNDATSVTVYDTLGVEHRVQLYFSKAANNQWRVYAAQDGAAITGAQTDGSIAILNFDTSGKLTTTVPATTTFPIPMTATGGAAWQASGTINLDMKGTTQFGSSAEGTTTFSVNKLTQDGFASGRLAGFSSGADGVIVGRYTNGKTSVLGQIVLANFANPNGLEPLGNNTWAETSTSGQSLIGVPNTGSLGVLQSSAVEDSNVDLTGELVTMITAQRIYQANAQTIKTQDQILQTLVNLR